MSADFRPDDPLFYLGDPWAAFKRLRREDPLHWYEPGGFWCITKHDDLAYVSRSPELFSSARGIQIGMGGQNERPLGVPPTIIEMDPPEHNRHRKLVIQAFTPRVIAGMEPRIRTLARESLDAVPRGEAVNFVERVAVPLPMYVIAEMLGVPKEDWADFRRWSDAMIEAGGGNASDETRACMGEMLVYLQQRLEETRRAPRDDVLSILAEAEIEGDRLEDPEILMFLLTLLVAGNETTRNLISGGTWALLSFPDQARALREDPGLLPNAIEEMLRWWTPVWSFQRRATRDTELRGKALREGDPVLLLYPSANRDEEIWGENSDAFDVTRSHEHRRHLSFGFGEHLCLGASLARLEARVMFEELLLRAPGFEPAGAVTKLPSRLMHGIVDMPVVFKA